MNLVMIPLYSGKYVRYTKDRKVETGLQCSKDKIFYTSGNSIYWQKISSPGKENFLGKVPASLATAFAGLLRHFIRISPDGKTVAWPGNVELNVEIVDTKKSIKIFPPENYTIVHPAVWRTTSGEIFYMIHNSSTGDVQFRFRDLSKTKDSFAVSPLGKSISSVTSFEAYFSPDGRFFAVNLDALTGKKKKLKRFFVLIDRNLKKIVPTNKKWKFERFHGFTSGSNLVFSGLGGGVRGAFKLYTGNKSVTIKRIEPLRGSTVYGFFAGRKNLIFASRWKKCAKPRLESVTMWGKHKRLLKWTSWSEIISMDRHRTWALFRGGSGCNDKKPSLYLMRTDGSLLLRELPHARFYPLRKASPEDITLCD
ncbi:MAG: hypothetical protein JXR95_05275 [Deltaproteobacteria bacterium]|nr:hypothetical protein [Deltaproteobacteria bacterium]